MLRLDRVGKRLGIATSGGTLVVGAGMSGYWRLALNNTDVPEKHDILRLTCTDHTATFNDARRFGSLAAWEYGTHNWHRDLGPDGLSDTLLEHTAKLGELFAQLRGEVKPLLLDQSLLAGVGNIYASEILHALRINPHCKINALPVTVKRLLETTHRILNAAADGNGTTIAGANPHRTPGDEQTNLYCLQAYAREEQPCLHPRCGGTIVKFQQAGRATYACNRCQLAKDA